MNIIYVDDEAPARINFRLTAEPLGGVDELHMFDNAQGVLDWLREHDADVAFLDLELGGGVGGMELARMLQQQWPAISVVFVTAYSLPFISCAETLRSYGMVLISKRLLYTDAEHSTIKAPFSLPCSNKVIRDASVIV